ncbi:SDR family oxidoreductase [Candidatus Woesearchaeota archaeon]|nr:SDR family oxidoreductase [Candidatus Woesearchaeota archaeon]
MKILVIGAGGFTGSYLFRLLSEKYEVIGTSTHNKSFEKLELSQFNETYKKLKKISPDVIYLPAGITNMDYIENNPMNTRKINVLGAANIVNYCKESNCRMVFFSSDAIFDGKSGPYSENSNPNPISEYGRQKLEAENFVKKLKNSLIIRTSSLYGWDNRNLNFISRLIGSLKSNMEFKAPTNQFYTPTYVVDLAYAALKLLEKDLAGTYNIAGPDFMSRHQIALNFCKVFGFKKELVAPVKSPQLGQTAKRPQYAGLINKKAEKELGIKFRSLKEGLKDMLKNQNFNGVK